MTGASSFRTQQERYCQHHGPFWALIFLNKRVMPETSNFRGGLSTIIIGPLLEMLKQ